LIFFKNLPKRITEVWIGVVGVQGVNDGIYVDIYIRLYSIIIIIGIDIGIIGSVYICCICVKIGISSGMEFKGLWSSRGPDDGLNTILIPTSAPYSYPSPF